MKAAFTTVPEDRRDVGDSPPLDSLVGVFEANTAKCPDCN
jgi:hypothetical protein